MFVESVWEDGGELAKVVHVLAVEIPSFDEVDELFELAVVSAPLYEHHLGGDSLVGFSWVEEGWGLDEQVTGEFI